MSENFINLDAWVYFLGVVALIYGFIWLHAWRRGRLKALDAQGPLRKLLVVRGGGLEFARAVLIVIAASLIVVAMMRPKYGTKSEEVQNLGIDVVIAMDASKSMKVRDVVPDRLQAAHHEAGRLIDKLVGGRVGLVPFAGLAFIQTPLTSDFQVVKTYLRDLRVEEMPRGGTAIGRAIIESLRALVPAEKLAGTMAEIKKPEGQKAIPIAAEEGSRNKAIVLFTDGENHEGDALEAAKLAKKLGVKIYTVAVGTAQGRPVPVVNDRGQVIGTMKQRDGKTPLFSGLNTQLLAEISDTTGGESFHLGPEGLGTGLFEAIDRLEKGEYQATIDKLGADRYQWPLIPAIVLILCEGWLGNRRRRRKGGSA